MNLYYDREGKPLDSLYKWAILMQDRSYQVIKQTRIGKHFVSTVWLGLDHSFSTDPHAKPIIFETMVFGPNRETEYEERYSTEAEAIMGHIAACDMFSTPGWYRNLLKFLHL